jgi:hypothetical protein
LDCSCWSWACTWAMGSFGWLLTMACSCSRAARRRVRAVMLPWGCFQIIFWSLKIIFWMKRHTFTILRQIRVIIIN